MARRSKTLRLDGRESNGRDFEFICRICTELEEEIERANGEGQKPGNIEIDIAN